MMECKHYRSFLSPFLDGELPVEEAKALEAHLAECAACRAERDRLARVRERVRRLPRLAAPEGFRAAVMERIPAKAVAPTRRPARLVRWTGLAASFLVMAVTAWLVVHSIAPPAGEKGEERGSRGRAAVARKEADASRAVPKRKAGELQGGERLFRPAGAVASDGPGGGRVAETGEKAWTREHSGKDVASFLRMKVEQGDVGEVVRSESSTRVSEEARISAETPAAVERLKSREYLGGRGRRRAPGESAARLEDRLLSLAQEGTVPVITVLADETWSPPPDMTKGGISLAQAHEAIDRTVPLPVHRLGFAGKAPRPKGASTGKEKASGSSGFLEGTSLEKASAPVTWHGLGEGREWYVLEVEGDAAAVEAYLTDLVRSRPLAILASAPSRGDEVSAAEKKRVRTDKEDALRSYMSPQPSRAYQLLWARDAAADVRFDAHALPRMLPLRKETAGDRDQASGSLPPVAADKEGEEAKDAYRKAQKALARASGEPQERLSDEKKEKRGGMKAPARSRIRVVILFPGKVRAGRAK